MPAAKKVRWAELRVGVMAIAAMVILAVLIFLLTSRESVFAKNVFIYTYFSDSAALAQGAPVRLNGILIGSVRGIELSGAKDPQKRVRIVMAVQSGKLKDIPVDSIAAISAENVLGTKYINITMGQSSQTVKPGGTVPGVSTREFEDIVQRGYNALDSLQGILARVDKIIAMVEAGHGTIGKFLVDEEFYNRLVNTVAEMQKVSMAISSGKGTVGRLLYDESLYNQVLATVQRLDSVVADLQQGQGTAGMLLRDPTLYKETHATVAQLRQILLDIDAGKGTVGKLLKDEATYREINGLLVKLNATIDRANSGQGTFGQLLVNPQMYESITGVTNEMRALLKDIRANPKKFLSIRLHIF